MQLWALGLVENEGNEVNVQTGRYFSSREIIQQF